MNFYYFNYLIDYVYMLILNGFTQMNFIEAGWKAKYLAVRKSFWWPEAAKSWNKQVVACDTGASIFPSAFAYDKVLVCVGLATSTYGHTYWVAHTSNFFNMSQ
jgi:hypothetical protein